jgi:hypothetical protein
MGSSWGLSLAILKLRSLKPIAEAVLALVCFVVLLIIITPVFSTRPSRSAVSHWEANYSPVLPPGYSDFRGHWQSQDIGVQIFSFGYPEGVKCEDVLSSLVARLAKYQVHQRVPGEVALRCSVTYSDPNGFDEFRFVCAPAARRVYAMFANLDDEMESHPRLVEHLHQIAAGKTE